MILAVLAAGGVYLYQTPSSEGPASQPAPPQLTQVVLHQAAKTLLYLPLYVAVDEGFLKQEGIDVRVQTAGGDSQAFAALASGQAQFAQGDPTFVAISHERGGPGIVIASVLDRVAFWGVTFDKSLSRFSDPKGFKGLTVVTFPRPNTAYVVQEGLLARAGLKLGSDSFITGAAFGTELGPVQAGKAQIAATIEPTVSQALEQGGQIVFSYPDAWGPFLLTGLMTTEEYAEKNPAVVRGMVNAYERALQVLRTAPERAITVGQRNFPEVSAAVIRSAVSRLTTENVFPEHAAVSLDSWRAALQLRLQVGDLKSAQHDALVDNRFTPPAR
jgi:NitT/TauT family transport system substrate-binding protein